MINRLQNSDYPIAQKVLMIEPVNFGFNAETAVNNHFQQAVDIPSGELQKAALDEFRAMVDTLRQHGIEVISVKDNESPYTPDSIFPNNWISFHEDGQVVTYPMFAQNRRAERRADILQIIENYGRKLTNIIDFSFGENESRFLEGTGSMILDRGNKIAYAAISERTDKSLFLQFCITFGFTPVSFSAFQTVENERKAIYHTNVMLCVADTYAVICTESIDDKNEREKVKKALTESGKTLVEITDDQMHHFAGNMLQLANAAGKKFLVLSKSAYNCLTTIQIDVLKSFNQLIVCDIPTIEQAGGGSVRCMMAEVF